MTFPLVNIIAIGVGAIVSMVGTILLVVAAFRRNVLWGLAVLFAPFGNIIFTCIHWAEARGPFLTSILGGVVCFGAAYSIPEVRAHVLEAFHRGPPAATVPDLSAQIQEHRDQLEALQAAFAQDGAALAKEYGALEKQRKELKPKDTAAITKFNEAAAAYQARNAQRKQMQQDIDKTQQELSTLLETRARSQAPAAPAASPKKVVMYTTSHCPACAAARQYLAQKGVPYEEIDVEHSRDGALAFQKLGGHGVPLILVGDKRMEGFNPQTLEAAL